MKIIFTDTIGVPEKYYPQPASRYIPDWYKDLDSYIENEKKPDGKGGTTGTIKRCMPVFDSISSGYIIPTACDIWVRQIASDTKNLQDTQPFYEWPTFDAIAFHPIEQVSNYPNNTGHKIAYPKFINPWSIKTPPGYSTLFVQPWHRKSEFTILPGIVDTDKYTPPVNFPFILNNIKFEGLIPAGTPIAQVVPFKRDSWQMQIGGQEELREQNNTVGLLRSKIFDSYKTQYRQIKEYQ
jgi:hypothetical protein